MDRSRFLPFRCRFVQRIKLEASAGNNRRGRQCGDDPGFRQLGRQRKESQLVPEDIRSHEHARYNDPAHEDRG